MKTAKWICRYFFFAILLGLDAVWIVLCRRELNALLEVAGSTKFVDIALENFSYAVEILDKTEYYKSLLLQGIFAGLVIVGLLVLVIVWNVFGNKVTRKLKGLFNRKDNKDKTNNTPKPCHTKAPENLYTAEQVQQNVQENVQENVQPENVQSVKGKFCTNCGAYHEVQSAFCTNCGAKIN